MSLFIALLGLAIILIPFSVMLAKRKQWMLASVFGFFALYLLVALAVPSGIGLYHNYPEVFE
ncbi:MAG: hypothetical protein NXH88_10025 [Hyphomonas sp.]|nr:hypothetical protein [Hyphomonas sp.]